MSHQAMIDFISALPGNAVLAERLRAVVEQEHRQQAIEGVARVAGDAGYEVDTADVAAFRSRALELLDDGELSEENLEQVAGGLIGVSTALFLVGGAAGVGLVSTVAAGSALGGTVGTVAAASAISHDFKHKVTDFLSKW